MTSTTYTFNTGSWGIGYDYLRERFHDMEAANGSSNYPPYNIIKHDEEHWSIELAVAGFKRSELNVELANGVLSVSANSETSEIEPEALYVHRGLAKRAFTRKWTLAEDVVVQDATLIDGVITIHLERIVPEEKKPRKIEIS